MMLASRVASFYPCLRGGLRTSSVNVRACIDVDPIETELLRRYIGVNLNRSLLSPSRSSSI